MSVIHKYLITKVSESVDRTEWVLLKREHIDVDVLRFKERETNVIGVNDTFHVTCYAKIKIKKAYFLE
ncbi:hypothetical protein EI200_14775 [Peribacillus simplex]|uniref:hypothetical protein n=1 Tax=Peribacillus simplex TaxID=1478 RepID=UPI000F62C54C|nr:hypothetical protein [Peribacillus simplex]RRN70227.1 hypothetical protein EI200_14775 [Peribacillus simplex]